MSKPGQSPSKADTGGQRVPKNEEGRVGTEKKAAKGNLPARKSSGKKPAP